MTTPGRTTPGLRLGLRRSLLAALVLLVALGLVYRGELQSLVFPAPATPFDKGMALARVRMNAAQKNPALAPGDQTGDEGSGYTWRMHVAPAATADQGLAISVSETWKDGESVRSVQLEGRRPK